MLKKDSRSVRRAVPDGAYTFMSFKLLYSADMARPDGILCIFVKFIPLHTSMAVSRIVVPTL